MSMEPSRDREGRVAVVTGAALGIGAAWARLYARAEAVVLVRFTASPHAFLTSREIAADAATKAGQVGLMRALALEGAPYGIRVNAMLPGAADAPMLQREAESSGDPAALLVASGASNAASGVTGGCIAEDGGLMAAINTRTGISCTGEST
jgi:NAD(P)-dependent dehydrogenase (short-subunit alcohol dehydrogenase family)